MAQTTDYTVQRDDLLLLSHFVKSAETRAAQLVAGWVETFELERVHAKEDDKIFFAPDNTLCTVSYRVEEWRSREFGRWVFFKLDSQIRHASTIVAAMGIAPEEGAPMFVMNLNLKPSLSAYNVVMGLRGGDIAQELRAVIPGLPQAQTQPLIVKDRQPGFYGHRLVFPMAREPIDWSVSLLPRFAALWRESLAEFRPSAKARDYYQGYLSDSLALHARSGTVFDEIFGANWVSRLFRDTIHKA
jgi:hypothetical protein